MAEGGHGEATLIRHLLPRASGQRVLPALPSLPGGPHFPLDGGIQARFEGWADCTDLWRQWVAKLRPLYEDLWSELGILKGVLATTYRVRRPEGSDAGALLQLVLFWCPQTNTFVFPWGEATVTLEDVAVLAGLPLVGHSVREPLSDPGSDELDDVEEDERALDALRAVLMNHGKGTGCVEHFLSQPRPWEAPGAGSRITEEEEELLVLEHDAFLALWLDRFVLPSNSESDTVPPEEVLQLAVRMGRLKLVALAPAALASIYRDLSALSRHFIHAKRTDAPSVSAPMHILQLWVWERFPELRPPMAPNMPPVPGYGYAGRNNVRIRAARWHDVYRPLDAGYVRAVLMAPREFKWRPYTGLSTVHLDFERCLRACELVGVDDVEQYNPHRVARQLGFEQDVPGTVTRLNTSSWDWEEAWKTYDKAGKDAFAEPRNNPGVTDEYAHWWKPYPGSFGWTWRRDNMFAGGLNKNGSGSGGNNNMGSSSIRMMEEGENSSEGELGGLRKRVVMLTDALQKLEELEKLLRS